MFHILYFRFVPINTAVDPDIETFVLHCFPSTKFDR